MEDFEKLGLFYLGKVVDPETREPTDHLLLYESKHLTTHAVCVGMTGSGKTGLGITLLEEGALDKIPALIVDPKGDLGNLLLTFPSLAPADFMPWIDASEAERKGMTIQQYAESVAKTWKDGLGKWGEDSDRIKRLKDAVDIVVYTPASSAGIPISILSSFNAPSKEMMQDSDAIRDRILSLTSSILGLLGIGADPIKSREHILIATIIDRAWKQGEDLDISKLIQAIQKPSFNKIGALDINTFYPAKERLELSRKLNNLLASPGFQAWMEGEPLDIQRLLYTKGGKPKLSILSIAHLSDSERMFFVTLLLNEVLTWMRRQPGTTSLRAILYMDEVFGYFPPVATPPSKLPMLTLLKQARAYGLGVVLATQNPVDLDYKGLSNCGTWFIGKLQTERDKNRVLEGLRIASNGEIDAASLDQLIASIGNRTFIMRSIYEKNPILFQTRWTMSYLRGPMTLSQIASLTDKSKMDVSPVSQQESKELKPLLPADVPEFFVKTSQPTKYVYRVVGMGRLHYVDSKNKIDLWKDICLVASIDERGDSVLWNKAKNITDLKEWLMPEAPEGSTYSELPSGLLNAQSYTKFQKSYEENLYQNQVLNIYQIPDLKLVSKVGESEEDFKTRANIFFREKRDEMIQKLREKFAPKIATLTEKVKKAQEKMTAKQEKVGSQTTNTLITIGSTILGALLGKGVTKGTITSAGTSIKSAGKISKDKQVAAQAEEDYQNFQKQLQSLREELQAEIDKLSPDVKGETLKIETYSIRPKKGDIVVEKVALVWFPVNLASRLEENN